MSNLKRLKTLLLANSNIQKGVADDYKGICYTQNGFNTLTYMFKEKGLDIKLKQLKTSPFYTNKKDIINHLCKKNKFIQQLIANLELE
jgi:hypothetical protein